MSSIRSSEDDQGKERSSGRVKLVGRDGNIILIPRPSSHPDDPLNWSRGFKIYVTIIMSFSVFMCKILATGPSAAIIQMSQDFDPNTHNMASFFTMSALAQGTGNLFWQPLITRYGRRPIYIISFSGYFLTALWCGLAQDYPSELNGRILLGFFSATGESLGLSTINDLFFLHERAIAISIYNFALASGVSIGIIFSVVITLDENTWRNIYYIGTLIIGNLVLLIIFTFPETAYNRSYTEEDNRSVRTISRSGTSTSAFDEEEDEFTKDTESPERDYLKSENSANNLQEQDLPLRPQQTKPYFDALRLFTGETYTTESLYKIFKRPFLLILLPPILWTTLIMTTTVSFSTIITSRFLNDFSTTYNFSTFQTSLCLFPSLVGALFAIPAGGWLGEYVAQYLTMRNGGVRVPEFRLPVIGISVLTIPLGLAFYGLGVKYTLPFMLPMLGLGLVSFSTGQAVNISLAYTIDSYSPIAGEIITTQLAFKSIFIFALSAFTNPWIASPSNQLGGLAIMAGISAFVLSLSFPMFIWGTRMRRVTLKWELMELVHWAEDREKF